ncbi:MAG: acylphosphatase [Thermoplasmata archaeon]|nr:acylphosphatase [Thermoplasmata archaeon]
MKEVKAHVFFSGHVQGVFFRAFTRENALKLGIRGWVRNLPDGRVEAVFEGPREKVDKLIYLCRYKHPYARVDDVEIEYGEPEGYKDFRVRY